jgi:hypothetical protein
MRIEASSRLTTEHETTVEAEFGAADAPAILAKYPATDIARAGTIGDVKRSAKREESPD